MVLYQSRLILLSALNSLRSLCLLCSLLLASALLLPTAAAEEDLAILTIEGDLLGRLDSLKPVEGTVLIIDAYYSLLPETIQDQVQTLRQQLAAMMPGYEVAFLAADSSELAELMFDIDLVWAEIRTIHSQKFTAEVAQLLNEAYNDIFSKLGTL